MKIHNRLGVLCALMFLCAPVAFAQNNLVANGDFEAGDLSGWMTSSAGAGSIAVYSAGFVPPSGVAPPDPPGGGFASLTSQTAPGTNILYQDVALPAGRPFQLSLMLYYINHAGGFSDAGNLDYTGAANQQLRIDIMDPAAPIDDVGAGVWMSIMQTVSGDPLTFGYAPIVADLSAFAGQTIRLRIAEVDNQFYFDVGVDDVSIVVNRDTDTLPIPVDNPAALITLLLVLGLTGTLVIRRRVRQ